VTCAQPSSSPSASPCARVGQPPADLCARLDAWRRAGYPAGAAPKIDDPAFDAIFDARKQIDRDTEKVEKAGRRLRALGVSKRVVAYWTGEDRFLFKGINTGDPELHIGDAYGG
jgi:hypothetical protein